MTPFLVAIIILGLLVLVVFVVGAPLRTGARGLDEDAALESDDAPGGAERLDELEAERETKYREIRDCELDYRTGKLSREDYEATDAQLRAEAIAILDRLEGAGEGGRQAQGGA